MLERSLIKTIILVSALWSSISMMAYEFTPQILTTLAGHPDDIESANFSHDGSEIITASEDGTVKLWSTGNFKELSSWFLKDGNTDYWDEAYPDDDLCSSDDFDESDDFFLNSAALSHSGQKIVTRSCFDTTEIWSIDGVRLSSFNNPELSNCNACFSPDDTRILTGKSMITAMVIDASSGEEIFCLKGHTDAIRAASFSPDGTLIATASDDKSIKIWSTVDGKLLRTLQGHESDVRAVRFSDDNNKIISKSSDGVNKLWRISDGKLLKSMADGSFDCTLDYHFPSHLMLTGSLYKNGISIWALPTSSFKNPSSENMKKLKGHLEHYMQCEGEPSMKGFMAYWKQHEPAISAQALIEELDKPSRRYLNAMLKASP